MENYCNNCGNFGHLYKDCRYPILSYGIILYNKEKTEREEIIYRIIMVERKDSLSYIEFLRGKYKTPLNYEYIQLLISRMTKEETKKLLSFDFDTLWEKLWIHTETINQRIKKEYQKSKIIFNQLKGGIKKEDVEYSLETIIQKSSQNYSMNEWEIPKGRRKGVENNKKCAIREFEEETNVKEDQYQLVTNVIPLIEEYRGINNVRYKHVYYLGEIDQLVNVEVNMDNINQYTEIKSIQWLTKEECFEKIRDYDVTKKEIIDTIFNFLFKTSNELVIKKQSLNKKEL